MLENSSNLPHRSRLMKLFTMNHIGSLAPLRKTKAAPQIDVAVFQRCKDKSLVCLIGASDSDSHAPESLLRSFMRTMAAASMAGVVRGQQRSAGVKRCQWATAGSVPRLLLTALIITTYLSLLFLQK